MHGMTHYTTHNECMWSTSENTYVCRSGSQAAKCPSRETGSITLKRENILQSS